MIPLHIAIVSNSFGTTAIISIVGSLPCSIVFIPSTPVTKSSHNNGINSSLLLFDNDDRITDITTVYRDTKRMKTIMRTTMLIRRARR